MKVRGTFVLIAWGPAYYLSCYLCWLAAWYTLGHRPRSGLDDPKRIEGFWMWTYDLSALILVLGLPLAYICALVSLIRTPGPSTAFGRLRLPEWGLAALVAVCAAWFAVDAMMEGNRYSSLIILSRIASLHWAGILAGIFLSVVFLFHAYMYPNDVTPTQRNARLTEISFGFVMIVASWAIVLADLTYSPLRVLDWWFD